MRKAVCDATIQQPLVKEELEWDGGCGVSEAAAYAGLYVKHEVKPELVLGPELLQPQDIVYKLLRKPVHLFKGDIFEKDHTSQSRNKGEPILDARCIAQLLTTCHVPLHRLPDTIHPQKIKQKVTKESIHTDKVHPHIITNNRHELDGSATHTDETDLYESDNSTHYKDSSEKIADTSVCKENVKLIALTVRADKKKAIAKKIYKRKIKEKKKYQCKACGEEFTAKKKLKAHATVHRVKKTKRKLNEGKYTCDACGRKFLDKKKLLFHMLVHMGLRPYKCGTCNSQFTCQARLDKHQRSHTGEKKYICDICGKRYTEKYSLAQHILFHMGGKPHTCEVCGKQFSCSRYLDRHKRLHSDVKSHTCEICKQQFRWLSTLIQHRRIHTGVKDICEVCGKSFARLTGLKRHYLIHEGLKPYPCQYCKKKFRTKLCLRGHTDRVHTYKNRNVTESSKTSLEETESEMTLHICETRQEQSAINGEAQHHETAEINTESSNTEVGPAIKTLSFTDKTQIIKTTLKKGSVGNTNIHSSKDTPLVNTEKPRNLCGFKEDQSHQITNESRLALELSAVHKDTQKSQQTPETSLVGPKNALNLNESKEDLPGKSSETLTPLDIPDQLNETPHLCEDPDNNIEEHPLETPLIHANTLDSESRDDVGNMEKPPSLETSDQSELNLDVRTSATSPTCHDIIDLISNLASRAQETQIKLEFSDEFLEIQSKPYSCDTCGKRYAEKKSLVPHCRAHMKKKSCDICNKTYTHNFHLERHMRTHIEKPKFECQVCGIELSSLHSLARHGLVHTTVKRNGCNVCKKKFKQLSDLKRHSRTHTGVKPYKCDVCHAQFGTQCNLKRHKLIHDSKKPFSCDLCGKQFARRAYALLHRKIHTGEKCYTCDICDKQFLHQNSYLGHRQLHDGPREKPFSCQVCGVKFTTSGHLVRHMRAHTGSKPFGCDLCGKRFYTKAHLERHVKSQKRPCVD